jgi:hypothetical protein
LGSHLLSEFLVIVDSCAFGVKIFVLKSGEFFNFLTQKALITEDLKKLRAQNLVKK